MGLNSSFPLMEIEINTYNSILFFMLLGNTNVKTFFSLTFFSTQFLSCGRKAGTLFEAFRTQESVALLSFTSWKTANKIKSKIRFYNYFGSNVRCIATSTLRSEELGKFAQGKKIDISNILTRLELNKIIGLWGYPQTKLSLNCLSSLKVLWV